MRMSSVMQNAGIGPSMGANPWAAPPTGNPGNLFQAAAQGTQGGTGTIGTILG
jgi:hypothetical protein